MFLFFSKIEGIEILVILFCADIADKVIKIKNNITPILFLI